MSTVTVTSEHTLNVTAPGDIDPTALCVDAPPQTAIPEVKDQACAAQVRGHRLLSARGPDRCAVGNGHRTQPSPQSVGLRMRP